MLGAVGLHLSRLGLHCDGIAHLSDLELNVSGSNAFIRRNHQIGPLEGFESLALDLETVRIRRDRDETECARLICRSRFRVACVYASKGHGRSRNHLAGRIGDCARDRPRDGHLGGDIEGKRDQAQQSDGNEKLRMKQCSPRDSGLEALPSATVLVCEGTMPGPPRQGVIDYFLMKADFCSACPEEDWRVRRWLVRWPSHGCWLRSVHDVGSFGTLAGGRAAPVSGFVLIIHAGLVGFIRFVIWLRSVYASENKGKC